MEPMSSRHPRFKPVKHITVTSRERLVLSLIREAVELTRSDLIRRADLPGAAVFRATEDLASRGLIELGETVASGPGKPSNMVRLHANALATVGLSVMTDHAEAVLLDFAGAVRARRDVSVAGMDCDAVLDTLSGFIGEAAELSGIAPDAIFGVGVAIAGYFVDDVGRVNPAAPLDSWALKDLGGIVASKIGLETTIENIANAAAVGERLLGVGLWANSFAYINVSHGLGAGLILDGELHRGRYGNAGEIAGMLDQFAKLPVPNLETLRAAIARKGIKTGDVADLVARYRDDWPGVAEWVTWAEPSFSFLASLFHRVLDCDAIVIGGRLPTPLAQRIVQAGRWPDENSLPRRGVDLPPARLVAAEVTASSSAIGAAAIPLRRGYFR